MAARQLRIRGVVQGVGFRYAMCTEAQRLGLRGWVRNRRDGSVEALAAGPVEQLDALERWARRGPRAARVDSVEATVLADDALDQSVDSVASGFRQAETA
jgi:acylphosphatase